MPDVQREQRESENAETWRDFDATLEPWARYVLIKFTTNPDGERGNVFRVTIGRDEFKELASAMMSADPTAAIKAFGAAMQEAPEIQKAPQRAAAA
jgi:hypothetical protein